MYQLNIKKSVLRQIDALSGNYRQRVRGLIANLASNPRPQNAKLLQEKRASYRIALDHYRIVYRIEDDILNSALNEKRIFLIAFAQAISK